MYNEANGARISSSTSRLNNVEQVKPSGYYGPAVLKINPYGTFPADLEEYALAMDQEFVNASPPIMNLNVSNPKNVTNGTDFILNITVNNSGDISAHDVNTNVNLPSGFIIISGANPEGYWNNKCRRFKECYMGSDSTKYKSVSTVQS